MVSIVLQFQIMDMKFQVFILLIILVINTDAVDDGKALKNQAKKKRKRRTWLEVRLLEATCYYYKFYRFSKLLFEVNYQNNGILI